jgi:O-antigen ligase
MVFFHHWIIDLKYQFPLEIIIVFPLILYNYKFILHNNKEGLNPIIFTSFFLLMLLNIISAFNGDNMLVFGDLSANLAVSITYLLMFLYFLFGTVLFQKIELETIRKFIFFILLIVFFVVLFEYLWIEVKFGLINFYNVVLEIDYIESIKYRSIGPFKNPNNLAVFTSFLLAFLMGRKSIAYNFLIFGLAGFIIARSGSRTGLILISFLLIYEVVVKGKSFGKKIYKFVLIVIGIFCLFTFTKIGETPLINRVTNSGLSSGLEARSNIYWDNAFKLISESPVLGVGLIQNENATTDNFFLSVLKTNGLLGLILFLIPIFILMRLFIKQIKRGNSAPFLFMMVFLLGSITGDFFYSRPFYPFFFTMAGFYYYGVMINKDNFRLAHTS